MSCQEFNWTFLVVFFCINSLKRSYLIVFIFCFNLKWDILLEIIFLSLILIKCWQFLRQIWQFYYIFVITTLLYFSIVIKEKPSREAKCKMYFKNNFVLQVLQFAMIKFAQQSIAYILAWNVFNLLAKVKFFPFTPWEIWYWTKSMLFNIDICDFCF